MKKAILGLMAALASSVTSASVQKPVEVVLEVKCGDSVRVAGLDPFPLGTLLKSYLREALCEIKGLNVRMGAPPGSVNGKITAELAVVTSDSSGVGVMKAGNYLFQVHLSLESKETTIYKIGESDTGYVPPSRLNREMLRKLTEKAAADAVSKLAASEKFAEWNPQDPPPQPPPPPPPSRGYPPEPLSLDDAIGALSSLCDAMLLDPEVSLESARVMEQSGGGAKPVVVIGDIADLTRGGSPCAGIGSYLATARGEFQSRLTGSHRFTVKDLRAVEKMAPHIKADGNDQLSDKGLLEALGRHVSPDFFIAGNVEYYREPAKRRGRYRIHLGAYSFRYGHVVWEKTVEMFKALSGGVR